LRRFISATKHPDRGCLLNRPIPRFDPRRAPGYLSTSSEAHPRARLRPSRRSTQRHPHRQTPGRACLPGSWRFLVRRIRSSPCVVPRVSGRRSRQVPGPTCHRELTLRSSFQCRTSSGHPSRFPRIPAQHCLPETPLSHGSGTPLRLFQRSRSGSPERCLPT
jgi:hypothetical protein